METNANFWKKWWNSRSREISSDHELDRVSSLEDQEAECLSEKRLLDFIDPQKNDFIFDAGCGGGTNVSRLNSQVTGIVAMDLSEGMIDRCKKRIIKEDIPNVRLMVGNISDIGLKSDIFNKVLCMSVLHYLDDEECLIALKELVRISKDGGIIIFHVKNLSSLYLSSLYLAKKIKGLFKTNVIMEHYRPYRWYERELSKLGAQILDYDSVNVFLVDFLPKALFYRIQRMELKHYKGQLLKKHGADLHIKAQIKKTESARP